MVIYRHFIHIILRLAKSRNKPAINVSRGIHFSGDLFLDSKLNNLTWLFKSMYSSAFQNLCVEVIFLWNIHIRI
jgi:hypothetical protein